METKAKQIQRKMKDAMGDIDVVVKVPWDSGKELKVTYTKIKTREAHTVLYSCLLPAVKCIKGLFDVGDTPYGVVEAISEIPQAVSQDKFWDAAELLLREVVVDGKLYDGPDSFEGEDLFLMYLLVYHGVRVNIPFSVVMSALDKKKSENTTSGSGMSNDQK